MKQLFLFFMYLTLIKNTVVFAQFVQPSLLCCDGIIQLSDWAVSHYEEVKALGNIMRQQYYLLSKNGEMDSNIYDYPTFRGKSQREMNMLVIQRLMTLRNKVALGKLSPEIINKTNFFEQEAANILKFLDTNQNENVPHKDYLIAEFRDKNGISTKRNCSFSNLKKSESLNYHKKVDLTKEYISKDSTSTDNLSPAVVIPLSTNNNNVNYQYNYPISKTIREEYNQTFIRTHNDQNALLKEENVLFENTSWETNERNLLFQLFCNKGVTKNTLIYWQKKEEERLLNLAFRLNLTIEEIRNWHLQELENFIEFLNQNFYKNNIELAKLQISWLIFRNKFDKIQLIDWQTKNINFLQAEAKKINLHLEELIEMQRIQFSHLHSTQFVEMTKMKERQQNQEDKLNSILRAHNISFEEINEQIKRDQERIKNAVVEYQFNVSEVENAWKSEVKRVAFLLNKQNEDVKRLTELQEKELEHYKNLLLEQNLYIDQLIQKLNQNKSFFTNIEKNIEQKSEFERFEEITKNFTLSQLVNILNEDYILYNLTKVYQINSEDFRQFIEKIIDKHILWQEMERNNLEQFFYDTGCSKNNLVEAFLENQNYLENLKQKHQIKISELKEFFSNEISRLHDLGVFNFSDNHLLNQWQRVERIHLLNIINNTYISEQELKNKIIKSQNYFESIASQYRISLEEIRDFIQSEISKYIASNIIYSADNYLHWHAVEKQNINELMKKQILGYDELINSIKYNFSKLKELSQNYNTSLRELVEWYEKEIEIMKNNGKIYHIISSDWQFIERNRLYKIAIEKKYTLTQIENLLWENENKLNELALHYQISLEKLKEFHDMELNNLVKLGFVYPNELHSEQWKINENKRLNILAIENLLTKTEIDSFLKYDTAFHLNLSKLLRVSLDDLEQHHSRILNELDSKGKFQNFNLSELSYWKARERDRIFLMLNEKNINVNDLLNWQNYNLHEISSQYKVDKEKIKNWQIQELKRIKNVAKIYDMDVMELANFYQHELERLRMFAHKSHISFESFLEWYKQENNRLIYLIKKYDIKLNSLENWRKYVVLQCKGIITSQPIITNQPTETSQVPSCHLKNTNNNQYLNRGDQPPKVCIEDYDEQTVNV